LSFHFLCLLQKKVSFAIKSDCTGEKPVGSSKKVPTPPFYEYNVSGQIKNIKKKADKRRIFFEKRSKIRKNLSEWGGEGLIFNRRNQQRAN